MQCRYPLEPDARRSGAVSRLPRVSVPIGQLNASDARPSISSGRRISNKASTATRRWSGETRSATATLRYDSTNTRARHDGFDIRNDHPLRIRYGDHIRVRTRVGSRLAVWLRGRSRRRSQASQIVERERLRPCRPVRSMAATVRESPRAYVGRITNSRDVASS